MQINYPFMSVDFIFKLLRSKLNSVTLNESFSIKNTENQMKVSF